MSNRLLLFARIDLSIPFYAGLKRKIDGQAGGLRALGYNVDLVHYSEKGLFKNMDEQIYQFKKNGRISRRLNYYRDSYIKLPDVIDFKQYDFLLMRYQMTNHFFVKMLAKIKKQNPKIKIIIEFPTFPFYDELISIGLKINLIFELATRNKLKKYVDNVITYCGQKQIYGIPAFSISNGIDANLVKPLNYTNDSKEGFNLVAVANLTKFHAYDRLIKGIKQYKDQGGAEKVTFHVVGNGVQFEKLNKLVQDLELTNEVIFYGFKKGEELEGIYKIAHIGIGGLGMHRKKLTMGAPLKVREYSAKGLPFVSHYDPGFGKNFFGMIEVPSDETVINVEDIVSFCKKFKKEDSIKLRQFAIDNLNWKVQLNKVFKDINPEN